MLDSCIKILFLLLALGTVVLAAHYYRYEPILEDVGSGTIGVYDRLLGKIRLCDINELSSFEFTVDCDYNAWSITK